MVKLINFLYVNFSLYVILLFWLSGIILIKIDSKRQKSEGLLKQSKISKAIGYIYLVFSPIIYVLVKIIF